MSTALLYALLGMLLFSLAMYGFWASTHLLRKILALNIMASGTFLALVGLAQRLPRQEPDPVPHALVLTGIVIAVSATALALILLRRLFALTSGTSLPEDTTSGQPASDP